ncbi:uncharacterized protein A4U43_C01F25560, partial [Asparagus officinalis]
MTKTDHNNSIHLHPCYSSLYDKAHDSLPPLSLETSRTIPDGHASLHPSPPPFLQKPQQEAAFTFLLPDQGTPPPSKFFASISPADPQPSRRRWLPLPRK